MLNALYICIISDVFRFLNNSPRVTACFDTGK